MNKIKGPKPFETVYGSLWVGVLVYYSEERVHSFHQILKRVRTPHTKTTDTRTQSFSNPIIVKLCFMFRLTKNK